MKLYLALAEILLSVFLIAAVLLQSKGAGFGGAFGTQAAVFRTRRGLERTLFQLTIVLTVLFVIVSLLSVRIAS